MLNKPGFINVSIEIFCDMEVHI